MTKGGKTTSDERIEIASYCIAHNHNYAKTAEDFSVSYQQARNYTIKYKNGSVDSYSKWLHREFPPNEVENPP